MDKDFEKTLAMLNGESVEHFETSQLSDTDRTQITNALDLIFQGLSLRNWLGGGILRDAWQNALDQIRDMVFAIDNVNAATIFARAAVFDMRTIWLDKMRTAPRTNMPIQCPESKRDAWIADADAKIQNGTELLMHKINSFVSGTPRGDNTQSVKLSPVAFKEVFNSRCKQEHQRVRERKM